MQRWDVYDWWVVQEFVLPGHKQLAKMAHEAGRSYILHSCGILDVIMDDLLIDLGIDGEHSFEDTILEVRTAKKSIGNRTVLLGYRCQFSLPGQ